MSPFRFLQAAGWHQAAPLRRRLLQVLGGVYLESYTREARFLTRWDHHTQQEEVEEEEGEEEFITNGDGRGKHNSLSRVAGKRASHRAGALD